MLHPIVDTSSNSNYSTRASLVASAEPAANAQPIALRRQHRVFTARREKTHQAAGYRLDIPMTIGRVEYPQLAARRRRPRFVQVQYQRHLALRAPLWLIDVAWGAGAR